MGDGNWWDPYCPCRVTRKNIVMTVLAMCCFALVTWTVVSSSDVSANAPKNVTFVFIDDSKSIENLNITLSSVLIMDAAEKAQEKKIAAVKTASDKALANKKTALRAIREPGHPGLADEDRMTLCKCLCGVDVTAEDLLAAVMYIVEARKTNKSTR